MLISEQQFDIWSMGFTSGLPSSQGYNTIYTFIDNFTRFVRFIPCFNDEGALNAPERASLFFSNTIRLFGILEIVLHNCNSRFTFNF